MRPVFLETIIEKTRLRVNADKLVSDLALVRSRAERVRRDTEHQKFGSALLRKDRINIIAEIKRASPSKGIIKGDIDVLETARIYQLGGAAAISVLTEPEYFDGSLGDLRVVAEGVDLPILRKDFIVDEYQVYEAAAAGADAVLLIAAALPTDRLDELARLVEELGMDAVVEVHDVVEMAAAASIGSKIIGINNRDLRSLEVSLDVSRQLIKNRPPEALMVCESGISHESEIAEFSRLGFDAFLIGETLMRSNDVASELGRLTRGVVVV